MGIHAKDGVQADGAPDTRNVGPVLFMRGYRDGRLHVSALIARAAEVPAPELTAEGESVTPQVLQRRRGTTLLSYTFSLRAEHGAGYLLDGRWLPLATAPDGARRRPAHCLRLLQWPGARRPRAPGA